MSRSLLLPHLERGWTGRALSLFLLAALLVVTGCTPSAETHDTEAASTTEAPSEDATEATARVDESGFELTLGDITAIGPPGVARPGTEVTLRHVGAPEGLEDSGVEVAAPVFDLTLQGGLQPGQPIAVTLELDDEPGPDDALAFVTQHSATGAWEGLPVELDGRKATVHMRHLSTGLFGWWDDPLESFREGMLQFLGQQHEAPDCVGDEPEIGDRRYAVSSDSDAVHVCVEDRDGRPVLTVHSNSPYAWRVRVDAGTSEALRGESPLSAAQILTLAAHPYMTGADLTTETLLVPGGVAPARLLEGAEGTYALARVDAGLGLVAIVAAGVGSLSAVGVEVPLEELVAIGECAGTALESATDESLATFATAVLTCMGTVVEGVAGIVVGGLVSLVPLLITQTRGAWDEVLGNNVAEIRVTSEPVLTAPSPDSWWDTTYSLRAFPGEDPADYAFENGRSGPVVVTDVAVDPQDPWRAAIVFTSADGEGYPLSVGVGIYRADGAGGTTPEARLTTMTGWATQAALCPSTLEWSGGDQIALSMQACESWGSSAWTATWTRSGDTFDLDDGALSAGSDQDVDWANVTYDFGTLGLIDFTDGGGMSGRLVGVSTSATDPRSAAVVHTVVESDGWPLGVSAGIFTVDDDGIARSQSYGMTSVPWGFSTVVCDTAVGWPDQDTITLDFLNCEQDQSLSHPERAVWGRSGTEMVFQD